jgi:hypothetical protein
MTMKGDDKGLWWDEGCAEKKMRKCVWENSFSFGAETSMYERSRLFLWIFSRGSWQPDQ